MQGDAVEDQVQQQMIMPMPNLFGRPSRRRRTAEAAPKAIELPMGLPRDESHTIVAMIVDRSGSMGSMGSEIEGGCNAYLEKQRAEDAADGTTTNVIFTRFDNVVETIINKPLAEVGEITHDDVKPRGSTALYDAIGDAMTNVAAVLNEKHRVSTPHVVIFILTDGAENASQRWSKKLVTDEIKKLQAPEIGWEFYFAAANQDAMQEGAKLGMAADNCMSWKASAGKGNIQKSMAFVQEAHSRTKKGMRRGWTAEERMECME